MLLSAAFKQRVGLDDAFRDAHIIYVDENNCEICEKVKNLTEAPADENVFSYEFF